MLNLYPKCVVDSLTINYSSRYNSNKYRNNNYNEVRSLHNQTGNATGKQKKHAVAGFNILCLIV